MKPDQQFTPKYWVFHNTQTDDVFIDTAAKSLIESEVLASKLHRIAFEKYEFNGDCSYYQFSSIEIKLFPHN
jgi:hypothetical protein